MDFPKKEAEALLEWMREQMYGDITTEWTYGNEHDRMAACADLIQTLVDREGVDDGYDEEDAYYAAMDAEAETDGEEDEEWPY